MVGDNYCSACDLPQYSQFLILFRVARVSYHAMQFPNLYSWVSVSMLLISSSVSNRYRWLVTPFIVYDHHCRDQFDAMILPHRFAMSSVCINKKNFILVIDTYRGRRSRPSRPISKFHTTRILPQPQSNLLLT